MHSFIFDGLLLKKCAQILIKILGLLDIGPTQKILILYILAQERVPEQDFVVLRVWPYRLSWCNKLWYANISGGQEGCFEDRSHSQTRMPQIYLEFLCTLPPFNSESCQTFDNKPSGEEDFYWIDHTANAKGQGFSGLYFGGPFVCPNLYNICRPKLVGRTLWGEEYLDLLPVHHVVHAKMAGPRHPRRSFQIF